MTRSGWLCFALFATGCSLFGLDDFDTVSCAEDNDHCSALNEQLGIDVASASDVYQCAPEGIGCVLGPKDWDNDGALSLDVPAQGDEPRDCDDSDERVGPYQVETCDGVDAVDNDCDGVIDEGLFVANEENLGSLGKLLFGSNRNDALVAGGIDFGSPAASRVQGSLDLITVSSTDTIAGAPDGAALRYLDEVVSSPKNVLVSAMDGVSAPSCPRAGEDAFACYPRLVASDGEASGGRLAAAVDYAGCKEGRVRIGEIRETSFAVAGRPASASCTGGYPFVGSESGTCSYVPGVIGASSLDLVRMPVMADGPPQALVAWSGTHELGHRECGSANPELLKPEQYDEVDLDLRTEVGVAALGIWHDPTPATGVLGARSVGMTRADGKERPEVLGTTRGAAAPAIESVMLSDGETHYVVGFASDEGPRLHAIERFAAVDDQCNAGALGNVSLAIKSAEPWNAAKPSHERADNVVLAKGREIADACGTGALGARIALAWQEGCGQTDASLWFAMVDFAPTTGFCNPSEPLKVRDLGDGAAPKAVMLALAYASSGVLRGDTGGGFWLASVDPDRQVRVQRFAERDGSLVDAEPVLLGGKDAKHVGFRVTDDESLELYVVRGSKDFRLTRARVSGGCAP